nr:tyrosine-protein phosphatase non-receptor type 20 isoform X2 [Saimiri boliviensis boliviensis]XP_010338880.1 tyrosine-protein phosphatase non-receptor type 20 isoform X2 [Saimiri boliviensis boliviensis]
MSSPRDFRAESVKDYEGSDPEAEDLNFRETLPSSSQKNTPRSKVFENKVNSEKVKLSLQNFSRNDHEGFSEAPSKRDGTPSMWTARGRLRRDRWNSEDEEHAGPSQAVSPLLSDDSTRVPLGKSKDYINASYIRIVNCGEEYFYIATQGPLLSTIDDFWQMVLENNSNVIAMITREIEGGVIKCYQYWPISLKKPLELKHFRVSLENYQILNYFIIRMFQVVEKSTGTIHSVKQLQFTKWPDHGTPASADSFIAYVRYARKSHLTGPMIVHCSAGIGRTGVFLCADVVFCAIVKNCSFNIMDIVAQMREQRSGMVQTKEQYHFCYSIVLEVLRKLLTLD